MENAPVEFSVDDSVTREFREIIKRDARDKMEAILEDYEREVPFDLDPQTLGFVFAEKLIAEAEILRANLHALLVWDQGRDSRGENS